MSESSEVDAISAETGRAARRAGEAVAAIVDRAKRAKPKMKRLSRADRREAQRQVSRILREERELERLERERLRRDLTEDIHAHHTAVWHGHQARPGEPMQDWYDRQQGLTRSRMAIEKRIITAGGLSDTHRGQAIRALRQAHYLPAYRVPNKVFSRAAGVAALRDRMQTRLARWRAAPLAERQLQQQRAWEAGWNAAQLRAAHHSEARRQQILAEQQGHQLYEMQEAPARPMQDRATPQASPKTAVSARSAVPFAARSEQAGPPWETNWLQADAVQDLRRAELSWLRYDSDPASPVPLDQVRAEMRTAMDSARAAGLSEDRINWELINVEANSRARTTMSYRSPTDPGSVERILGYHPTEAEAAEWAHDLLASSEWDPGTRFAVVGREAGRSEPYLKLSGDEAEIRTGVQQWRSEITEQARQRDAETSADPARNLRADSVHLDGEQIVAHTIGGNGKLPAGARVSTPTAGVGTANVQINGNSQVTAANIGGQVNGDNTLIARTREQQLQAKVAGLEKTLGGVTAERDQYRTERDEAVAKLVEATPPEQRYGSPQRRASETQRPTDTRSTGGPARQARQDGDAIRDAVQAMDGRAHEAKAEAAREEHRRNRMTQYLGREIPDCGVFVFGGNQDELRDPAEWEGWVKQHVPADQQNRWLADRDNILDAHAKLERDLHAAMNDSDSKVMTSKTQELFPNGPDARAGAELAQWWVSTGAVQYQTERKRAQEKAPTATNGHAPTAAATAVLDKERPPTAAQESRNQELFEASNQDAHEEYLASLEEEEPVIELTEEEG